MNIHHFIIHRVQKVQFADAVVTPSTNEQAVNPIVETFAESCIEFFQTDRASNVYANVDWENSDYGQSVNSFFFTEATSFFDFSVTLARALAAQMNIERFSTGGYLCVMHIEEEEIGPRLLVILLRQEEGFNVTIDGQTGLISLQRAMHLNLESVNVGSMLILADSLEQIQDKHLIMVRGVKRVSKYFREFSGAIDYTTPKEETTDLKNALEDYFENIEMTAVDAAERKRTLAHFFKDSKEGRVDLSTIAAIVRPDDPNDFATYANAKGVSAEVAVDHTAVLGWFRVSYRDKRNDLTLNFDKSNIINRRIVWEKADNELIIKIDQFLGLDEELQRIEAE